MDKKILSKMIRHRFETARGVFQESERIPLEYNGLIRKFLCLFNSEYLKKFGLCSHDLEIDKSDPNYWKINWGNEKRGKILNLILDDLDDYTRLGSIAHIIGHFLNDPIRYREISKFKKQVSYLLEKGDSHAKALLVGAVAIGLVRTSEHAKKISANVGPIRFDRWLDIRESEDELHEFLSVLVKNSQKERNHTSESITGLEGQAGGAQ